MSKTDIYLALLALAIALFGWAALAKAPPVRPVLVPLGLGVYVLAVFLLAAGIL